MAVNDTKKRAKQVAILEICFLTILVEGLRLASYCILCDHQRTVRHMVFWKERNRKSQLHSLPKLSYNGKSVVLIYANLQSNLMRANQTVRMHQLQLQSNQTVWIRQIRNQIGLRGISFLPPVKHHVCRLTLVLGLSVRTASWALQTSCSNGTWSACKERCWANSWNRYTSTRSSSEAHSRVTTSSGKLLIVISQFGLVP